jgi:choline dehydrogenase-like flavoprotein
MRRREFCKAITLCLPAAVFSSESIAAEGSKQRAGSNELAADVLVIGGGLGGCAAALAAAEAGRSVILTEETDWIGGQLTSQAVPPDEHPWIENFGATRRYRRLRHLIREYYRQHYPLTAAARAQSHLNPGGGSVSPSKEPNCPPQPQSSMASESRLSSSNGSCISKSPKKGRQ